MRSRAHGELRLLRELTGREKRISFHRGLTPELSRAAKRRRLGRIVSARAREDARAACSKIRAIRFNKQHLEELTDVGPRLLIFRGATEQAFIREVAADCLVQLPDCLGEFPIPQKPAAAM